VPGLIGIDFGDIERFLSHGGHYHFFQRIGRVGREESDYSRFSSHAACDFAGAGKAYKSVLIGTSGGKDMTLSWVVDAMSMFQDVIDYDADIVFSANIYAGEAPRISVIAKEA